MGARQSKRSVDITTTPKKGECDAVTEGEGKLEKIGDADVKVASNGAICTDIEFADNEQNGKGMEDAAKEKQDVEVKENGVSDLEENKTSDIDISVNPLDELATERVEKSEKTVDSQTSAEDNKVEETPETKKNKEKSKKKKWSFRSISFSKKDKSKPNKESDNNGDVNEVAEENAEEGVTAPTSDSQKMKEQNTTKSGEKLTNGDATAEELAKPEEATNLTEEVAKPDKEKPADVAPKPNEPTVPEPVVESAPSPVKEDVPPIREPTPKAEESQPVEPTPVIEETKVRSQEVPPPLPSSNPPSPVTVFAESTKADAVPLDQVPLETSQSPVSMNIVKSFHKISVTQPNVESVSQAFSPNIENDSNCESVLLAQNKVETVSSNNPLVSKVSGVEVKSELSNASLAVPGDKPVIEKNYAENVLAIQKTEEPIKESEFVPQLTADNPKSGWPPKHEQNVIEPPKSPILAAVSEIELQSLKTPKKASKTSEGSSNTLLVEENVTVQIKPQEEPVEPIENKIVDLPSVSLIASVEKSAEPMEKKIYILDSSANIPIESLENKKPIIEQSNSALMPESIKSIACDLSVFPVSTNELSADPPNSSAVPESLKSTFCNSTKSPATVESLLQYVAPFSEPSLGLQFESASSVPDPELTTEKVPEPLAETVVNADSLPDLSTESLPSLPEPFSENLAEPMSLPPVDSVPDPIATDGLPVCPVSDVPLPSDSLFLTNGNAGGLPSPTNEVTQQIVKEGASKQISTTTVEGEARHDGEKSNEEKRETATSVEE